MGDGGSWIAVPGEERGWWIPTGDESFGEVGSVSAEVIRVATDTPLPSCKRIRDRMI